MAATVMGDDPVALLQEEQHLSVPIVGGERPAMVDLRAGRLARAFPGWGGAQGIVHIVFTTRHGLPPAVRAFIDHLAGAFRELSTA